MWCLPHGRSFKAPATAWLSLPRGKAGCVASHLSCFPVATLRESNVQSYSSPFVEPQNTGHVHTGLHPVCKKRGSIGRQSQPGADGQGGTRLTVSCHQHRVSCWHDSRRDGVTRPVAAVEGEQCAVGLMSLQAATAQRCRWHEAALQLGEQRKCVIPSFQVLHHGVAVLTRASDARCPLCRLTWVTGQCT
jgi:hypothetical protein